MQNPQSKIPPLPAAWPHDARTRIRTTPDGRIFATHPDRAQLQLVDGKWHTSTLANGANHAKQ